VFTIKHDPDVSAGERPAEGDGLGGVAAVRSELHLTHREVVGRDIFFLNNHVIEDGFFANHDLRYRTAQRG